MPHTQGAELSALIYAWKDMAILLPAMSAVLQHHPFSDEERELLAHLLYLQAGWQARKSPLSTQLNGGACAASRAAGPFGRLARPSSFTLSYGQARRCARNKASR